jgi:hypothetical protein
MFGNAAGSDIRYVLEVSDDPQTFDAHPLIHKDGLKSTVYTVSLEPGTYYWRVKAVDGEGNESVWSYADYAFKVSELSSLTGQLSNFIEDNDMTPLVVVLAWL